MAQPDPIPAYQLQFLTEQIQYFGGKVLDHQKDQNDLLAKIEKIQLQVRNILQTQIYGAPMSPGALSLPMPKDLVKLQHSKFMQSQSNAGSVTDLPEKLGLELDGEQSQCTSAMCRRTSSIAGSMKFIKSPMDHRMPVQMESKIHIVNAKRPRVGESTKLVELTYETSSEAYTCNENCSFQFGPGQPDFTLQLQLDFLSHAPRNCILQANIVTNRNSGNANGRRDYFVHLSFMNDGKATSVYKWFECTTKAGVSESNVGAPRNHLQVINFTDEFLTDKELSLVSAYVGYPTYQITVVVKMIVKYHDPSYDSVAAPQPVNSKERLSKLFYLRGHLNNEVVLRAGKRLSDFIKINEMILRDLSPVFNAMLDPEKNPDDKPKELMCPFVSIDSMKAFHNFVYGCDQGVWLDNVVRNLEILELAENYLMAEVIQICTDNLIKTKDDQYSIELIIRIGKFSETYDIPALGDRAFEWMENKLGEVNEGYL